MYYSVQGSSPLLFQYNNFLPNAKKNMIKDTKSASMMQNQKLHFLYKVDWDPT